MRSWVKLGIGIFQICFYRIYRLQAILLLIFYVFFSDKIVVQHLLDHHAKSAKSRNIGQPQGGKKLLKQKKHLDLFNENP